jgi:hypothetical protein
MRIPKRIIHKISRIIKDSSVHYWQVLPDTQRDLFPQLLSGLLVSGSVYASDVARRIDGGSIGAKEMRVLRFVHHPKLSYDKLLCAHIQRLSSLIRGKDSNKGQKLRIYGDISELVKPWAVKMDAIEKVRDGSDPMERKKSGYWLNEVYISPNEGRIIPVVLYPFPQRRGVLRARLL